MTANDEESALEELLGLARRLRDAIRCEDFGAMGDVLDSLDAMREDAKEIDPLLLVSRAFARATLPFGRAALRFHWLFSRYPEQSEAFFADARSITREQLKGQPEPFRRVVDELVHDDAICLEGGQLHVSSKYQPVLRGLLKSSVLAEWERVERAVQRAVVLPAPENSESLADDLGISTRQARDHLNSQSAALQARAPFLVSQASALATVTAQTAVRFTAVLERPEAQQRGRAQHGEWEWWSSAQPEDAPWLVLQQRRQRPIGTLHDEIQEHPWPKN